MDVIQTKSKRLEYLDSLRGIAAISVVFSHFFLAYRLDLEFRILNFSPLHFFYDGFAAVTLFFILSGYVLTLSLEKSKSLSIGEFYIKRIFRIMPAYFFTLTLSFIAYLYFQPIETIPHSSPWIESFWNKPLDTFHLVKQLIFLNPNENAELIPQNWSLLIEMLFSFLMPFLYIIYKKTNTIYFVAFNIILYLLFKIPIFVIHFSLGIYLALNQNKILLIFQSIKLKYKFFLVLAILSLYTYRYTIPMYYYYFVREHSLFLNNEDLIWVVTGLGAFFLLIYCISSITFQKILNHKFFTFIGKVSYSIYLVHLIILIFFVPKFIHLLNNIGIFNKYAIWGSSLLFLLLFTIIISYPLSNLIEIPFAKTGNKIIKKRHAK